jgi:hypothetical protein
VPVKPEFGTESLALMMILCPLLLVYIPPAVTTLRGSETVCGSRTTSATTILV